MLPDQAAELLSAYVDGELNPAEMQTAEELLRRSADSRTLLGHMQEDCERVRALPRQSLDGDFCRQVMQSIGERRLTSGSRRKIPAWPALVAAASVFLVLTISSYRHFSAASSTPPSAEQQP
jgi:anti-sigma factor RsiW